MKNSTRRNIRRRTTPFGITLLVALAVSVVTGLFRASLTEAARGREKSTLVNNLSGLAPCLTFNLFDASPVDNIWKKNRGTSNF